MTKYLVTYQETFARTVIIDAASESEATEKMLDAVDAGCIELTTEDYVCESGEVVSVEPAPYGYRHMFPHLEDYM